MQNQHTGEIKKAAVGLSWTSLFFSAFVPLCRGHFSGAALWFIAVICTGGLSAIIQLFIYNKRYLQFLINNGFQVKHSPMPIEHVANKINMTLPVMAEE